MVGHIRRMEGVMGSHKLDHLVQSCRSLAASASARVELDNDWLEMVPSLFVRTGKELVFIRLRK